MGADALQHLNPTLSHLHDGLLFTQRTSSLWAAALRLTQHPCPFQKRLLLDTSNVLQAKQVLRRLLGEWNGSQTSCRLGKAERTQRQQSSSVTQTGE